MLTSKMDYVYLKIVFRAFWKITRTLKRSATETKKYFAINRKRIIVKTVKSRVQIEIKVLTEIKPIHHRTHLLFTKQLVTNKTVFEIRL